MPKKRSQTFGTLRRVLEAREKQLQTVIAGYRAKLNAAEQNLEDARALEASYESARFNGPSVPIETLVRTERFLTQVQRLREVREREHAEAKAALESALDRWRALNVSNQVFTTAEEAARALESLEQKRKMRRSASSSHRPTSGAWSMLNGKE